MKKNLILIYLFAFINFSTQAYNELYLSLLVWLKIPISSSIALLLFTLEFIFTVGLVKISLRKDNKSIYNWIIPIATILLSFYFLFLPPLGINLLDLIDDVFVASIVQNSNYYILQMSSRVLMFVTYIFIFIYYVKNNKASI